MCKLSHVAKTGDIKGFVITEESGIAKGIRRITAVTGHEAADVTRKANALTTKLDQIEKTDEKEKDALLKAYSVVCCRGFDEGLLEELTFDKELGTSEISVVRKYALKDRLATLRKAFDKRTKEMEQAAQKVVSY